MTPQERAADAYCRALELDPGNRPARFNLTILRLHEESERPDRARQIKHLERLRETAARPPAAGWFSALTGRVRDRVAGISGGKADPLWWRTTYALAAEHANRGRHGEAARAVGWARDGVLGGLRVLSRPRWVRTPIAEFVVDAMPPLAVLYAGLTSSGGDLHWCTPPHGRRKLRKAAKRLRRKVENDAATVREVVELVMALPGARNARTRYNLACLFSKHGRLEDAVEQFEEAVRALDVDMLDWATHDRSLEPIRKAVDTAVAAEKKRRAARDAAAQPPKPPDPPRGKITSAFWWREE